MIMTTITLQYDTENSIAKKALDFLLSLGVFKLVDKQVKITALDLAIQDVEEGRVNTYKSSKELFEKLRKQHVHN